ncbi:MAG: tetratricopeptide repeat protein [Planctomycetes bacterium]|nr:tetratricopeptide repeat protein [Planctomycetota bacterium]
MRRVVVVIGCAIAVGCLAPRGGAARAADAPPPAAPTAPAAPVSPAPAKPAPPPTPEQSADAVLAAIAAKDDAALKALAAKDDPDPWLVADELIRRGQHDAAEAFAKAAPRADVERLPEYVASRRGTPDDPARRERMATADAALLAREFAKALAALGPADAGPLEDVVGVRLHLMLGTALAGLVRLEDAAAVCFRAGEAAERVGWLVRARRGFHQSGNSSYRGGAFAAALVAFERTLAVDERRGDPTSTARTLSNIGLVHAKLGDRAKAMSCHEQALAALEASGDKAGAATTMGSIGVLLTQMGEHRRARSFLERALATQDALGDKAGAARTLKAIGDLHDRLGEYEKALSAFERARALHEALGDRAGAAATLVGIGSAHVALGEYEKALTLYERAMTDLEAVGNKAGAAATLAGIGGVHHARGDYAKALSTYERALAALEVLGDKAGATGTLQNIGIVYRLMGDHAKALSIYERVLGAWGALGDRAAAAGTLNSIGLVQEALGEYPKALSTYERALSTTEALGDNARAAATLGNIATVHFRLGSYAKALSTFERALAAKEALGDKAGAAGTLGDLGVVHATLGDHAKALAMFERALAAKEALGDKAGAATTSGNIGVVEQSLGDHAKALATFERTLGMHESMGDQMGAARTLGNIGGVHEVLGDTARALSVFERALAAQEALGDKAGAASMLIRIGTVQHTLGDSTKAIKFLERSARAAEKLGAIQLLVDALGNLAAVRLQSGDSGRALSDAHRAVSLLKTLVGGLGEEQGATARARYASLFSTGLAAAAKLDDASEAAFFVESGRAGTMLESLDARDALRHAALPETLRVAEAQARSAEARALVGYAKALDGDDLVAIRARDDELKAARGQVQEVGERIQREAKKVAGLWYPVATPVEDLQRFLVAGEALVLYGLSEGDGPAHALVLTQEEARIVALGASSAVVTACEALEADDASADPTAALARLRDLLVKPLGLVPQTTRLLVSPEGPLSYVPFAALVPELVVAYQASGTTYGVLLDEKDRRGAQVLALGDADYTAKFDPIALGLYAPLAAGAPGGTRGGRLLSLPGTREEAKSVGDVALVGREASEPGLRAALSKRPGRWRAIHFACHGLVNPDRPTLSSLALTPVGDDDGFLTAIEVLQMELPADLVVLSACETGKGKIVGGEGIVGLTRAFMYAGSPRVICSLWKVDDAATAALMTKFYELWNPKTGAKGMGTAEALRAAQEHVRSQEKWKHPYYWAAWVLWGLPS